MRLLTRVADPSVVDFDANLMRLRDVDFDFFKGQVFSGLPGNGGFALDRLLEYFSQHRREIAAI